MIKHEHKQRNRNNRAYCSNPKKNFGFDDHVKSEYEPEVFFWRKKFFVNLYSCYFQSGKVNLIAPKEFGGDQIYNYFFCLLIFFSNSAEELYFLVTSTPFSSKVTEKLFFALPVFFKGSFQGLSVQ